MNEFLGLRGRFYLSAERLYQLDEAGNPRLVRLVGTAACRMLRKLLEHKGTLVSTEILISAGWEYSEKKILEHATVRRRQSLFEQGDDVACVFLVLAGEVELFAENGHGRTVIARKGTALPYRNYRPGVLRLKVPTIGPVVFKKPKDLQ